MRYIWVILAFAGICGCRSGKDLSGGISLRLDSLYVRKDTLWFGLAARNRSVYGFRSTGMRFSIRPERALARRALQELAVPLVGGGPPTLLQADTTIFFLCGIRPRVPGPGRVLWIEWMERNGDRQVRMRVKNKRLMRAALIIK